MTDTDYLKRAEAVAEYRARREGRDEEGQS